MNEQTKKWQKLRHEAGFTSRKSVADLLGKSVGAVAYWEEYGNELYRLWLMEKKLSDTTTAELAVKEIDECRDFLCSLAHEWAWKRGTSPGNQREMDELAALIGRLQEVIETHEPGSETQKKGRTEQ